MTKRSHDPSATSPRPGAVALREKTTTSHDHQDDGEESSHKKARTFMATLACDICRSRKTRCDEDRPRCGYCRHMNIECTYQSPRPTKRDQSMSVAINAIRRLETKLEELTATIASSHIPTLPPPPAVYDQRSPAMIFQPSPNVSALDHAHDFVAPPQRIVTPGKSPYPAVELHGAAELSFSQHRVALWSAVKQILPSSFVEARNDLPTDYIIDIESHRPPLPIHIDYPTGLDPCYWLTELPLSVLRALADAYFSVFHRLTPVLDKFQFFSSTLGLAIESDFGYNIETCLVLIVLALGCLSVKAHEEGDFALPSRIPQPDNGFTRPEWYGLILDEPIGLRFYNEARKRLGFLMSQNDLQAGQFYMLLTLYYAQLVRPIDSWTTVNRAALCCMSILSRTEEIEFEEWEGDMFSRLFWNTLMYESIIMQELDLPSSGLLEYKANVPIPKFTPCPRPKTSISGLLIDEDDSFFSFHFLAQAAHRIILTRIRHNLYSFAENEGHPSPSLTAEMHHQLEQWRTNLPTSLQFADNENADDSPTPAHVIAKAMLRSRYLVAKFHIGRPFLYKALHAPEHTTDSEYHEIQKGLKGGMFWPTTMGLCIRMKSALPIKFGWCSQCFGQILLFNAVAQSPDPKLRDTLPDGWQEWVDVMMALIESCGMESPGVAKDAELLRTVVG